MRGRRAGLTLVEMLVVLAIIGAMAAVVTLSVGVGTRQVGAQSEANRLAERLKLAADDVLVTRRPISLEFDARGYRFVGPDGAELTATGAPEALLGRHDLPKEMKLGWRGVQSPAPLDPDTAGTLNEWAVMRPGETWVVAFDGLNARVQPYQERAS